MGERTGVKKWEAAGRDDEHKRTAQTNETRSINALWQHLAHLTTTALVPLPPGAGAAAAAPSPAASCAAAAAAASSSSCCLLSARTIMMSGSRKPSVLPDPVGATASSSLPASNAVMACRWMGVGSTNPPSARLLRHQFEWGEVGGTCLSVCMGWCMHARLLASLLPCRRLTSAAVGSSLACRPGQRRSGGERAGRCQTPAGGAGRVAEAAAVRRTTAVGAAGIWNG